MGCGFRLVIRFAEDYHNSLTEVGSQDVTFVLIRVAPLNHGYFLHEKAN